MTNVPTRHAEIRGRIPLLWQRVNEVSGLYEYERARSIGIRSAVPGMTEREHNRWRNVALPHWAARRLLNPPRARILLRLRVQRRGHDEGDDGNDSRTTDKGLHTASKERC